MAAPRTIRTEQDQQIPRAFIFNGSSWADLIEEMLKSQQVVVLRDSWTRETANYIFFFASDKDDLSRIGEDLEKAISLASWSDSKMVVIWENLSEEQRKRLEEVLQKRGWPVGQVALRGIFLKEEKEEVARKILRQGLSSRRGELQVYEAKEQIAGREQAVFREEKTIAKPRLSTQEVLEKLKELERRGKLGRRRWESRWIRNLGILLGIIVLVLSPMIITGGLGIWGAAWLYGAKQNLSAGKFSQSQQDAKLARESFMTASEVWRGIPVVGQISGLKNYLGYYDDVINLGATVAEISWRLAAIGPQATELPRAVMGESEVDLEADLSKIESEVDLIDQNLGEIEGQFKGLMTPKITRLLQLLGVPIDKLSEVVARIPELRMDLKRSAEVLKVLPQLTGRDGRRTYLLVFQNSAELRPTGGFIGSYAIIHFDHGRILDYKINDIYTADGQLRGRIAPPDEILHFLGQPSWFMRDANFAPDFPLTASRLEWFLEKETSQKVDGVIGIDLGAAQKMLKAMGPIHLTDFNDEVTAENLFNKAEFQSEINFFPGSSQKRDYLGAVAQAMLEKIMAPSGRDFLGLGQSLMMALKNKDILIYDNDPTIEKVFLSNGWGGSLLDHDCGLVKANCLMISEANFGANKANFYLKRDVKIRAEMEKGGKVVMTVQVNYQNQSPSSSWPGGNYKNYFRLLVPRGSDQVMIDLNDGRKASISGILTADILAKVPKEQFLLFRTEELTAGENSATKSAYESFGTLVEVPPGKDKTVTASYIPSYQVDYNRENPEFNLAFLKQPGTEGDRLTVEVDYPSFLKPRETDGAALVFPQRLIYNVNLNSDYTLKIVFKKEID